MPPVGFKPTISRGERPQTYALDRAATGSGEVKYNHCESLRNLRMFLKLQVLLVTPCDWERSYCRFQGSS